MQLKTLELQGFKSFPDKTVLTFDHPITAIVGPNGSGKSNLADAIRWVLGEQSARQLRGGRMEDVIFGGAQGRRGQGFAQVSLTLTGCQDLRPDQEDEITVTRRYYRSGESEYYLNRRQVRLRDVSELFMDTGLGQEGYALIGQGRIDEILSARSTQRREIFEEAAGISHCRHQKEETQRKLERTQENLLRVADKLEELELQRTPLQAQAEKARQYLALREELRVLEISLWLDQLEEAKGKSDKLRSQHEAALHQLTQCTQEADRLYAKSEELLLRLRDLEDQGERQRSQLTQIESDLRAGRQRVQLLQGRIQQNEAAALRLRGELAEKSARQTGLEEELARQRAHLSQLRRRETACREELSQAQADLRKTQETQAQARRDQAEALRQSQEDLTRCQRRQAQAEEAWMVQRMQTHTLAARQTLLEEMAQHYEGYTKGVKTAMNAVQAGKLSGVLGPVGQLFRVPARYTLALETALGAAMQNLLVEDEEAGKAVLQYLKQKNGGRITCLPLTALRPTFLKEEGLEQEPGVLAVAADLVDCPAPCRPAAQSLLGRTVVVDNLDHGVRLAKKRRYRFPVVTLDGEILRPGGSMTGGSVSRQGGILSRGAEEDGLKAQLAQAQGLLRQREEALTQAKQETQQAAQRLDSLQKVQTAQPMGQAESDQTQRVAALREQLAALEAETRASAPLLDQLTGQQTAAQADRVRQTQQLERYDRENQDLQGEIASLKAQDRTLAEQQANLSARLTQTTREKTETEGERTQTDRQARGENERQLRLQQESSVLEQKRLQASMEESRLLDKLWDTYGVTHQGALAIRVKLDSPAKASRQAARLKESIRALGQVNLGAVEEFQRVEERYQYLNGQRADVETARRELEGVIQEITREMKIRFLETFGQVRAAFSQTFADLFGGGQGALALEDETDVLNSGIEIRVQPPGKTLRAISLLSGGERSLVAIALYFALLKIHPTPFCVVDEIEAALDEANGARFIRYLRAMGRQTQFILITHRRETMEAADLLYGVTMERQGVSKVLRLDLHQAEALLETATTGGNPNGTV